MITIITINKLDHARNWEQYEKNIIEKKMAHNNPSAGKIY